LRLFTRTNWLKLLKFSNIEPIRYFSAYRSTTDPDTVDF